MPSRRHPCRGCRTPIDTDHASCPFCEAVDPLRYRRTRRALLTLALVTMGALAAAAWVLGV